LELSDLFLFSLRNISIVVPNGQTQPQNTLPRNTVIRTITKAAINANWKLLLAMIALNARSGFDIKKKLTGRIL
jgi:hypothetical protein